MHRAPTRAPGPERPALDWFDATQPVRTAVYCDRDGVLLWGGILWKRDRPGAGVMSLAGEEFESHLARRQIA